MTYPPSVFPLVAGALAVRTSPDKDAIRVLEMLESRGIHLVGEREGIVDGAVVKLLDHHAFCGWHFDYRNNEIEGEGA